MTSFTVVGAQRSNNIGKTMKIRTRFLSLSLLRSTAITTAATALLLVLSVGVVDVTSSSSSSLDGVVVRDVTTSARSPPPQLPWGDVNVLIVTDVHSWIAGHGRHHETSLWSKTSDGTGVELNVDYGDVLSFYQHLQEYANETSKNLFFVMNGDFTDGTGLTTYPPTRLCQLLETMPWDAINIGNHELYRNATVDALQHDFVPFWKGRYLTSNVLLSSTNASLGNRYIFLRGPTATILTFGFLYDMNENCVETMVEPVEQVVQQEWFQQVLVPSSSNSYDAILVLAHMHYLDPLIPNVLLPAIRQHVGPDMPIQFVTGHSHIRGYAQLDPYSASMEAGRYLDTLGFVSFPMFQNLSTTSSQPSQVNQTITNTTFTSNATASTSTPASSSSTTPLFQYAMIDANRQTLRSILNLTTKGSNHDVLTPDGAAFRKRIHQVQREMGLLQIMGCSPQTYYLEATLDDDQSLWKLYVRQVVPLVLFPKLSNNKPIFVQGTGGLRYDLFQGLVTKDDIVAICPYEDIVYQILSSVRGDILKRIFSDHATTTTSATTTTNNNNNYYATRGMLDSELLPPYAIAGFDDDMPLNDDEWYQLLTVDFDLKYWTERIYSRTADVVGLNLTVTPIPILDSTTSTSTSSAPLLTTTQLWMEFVATQWSKYNISNSSTSTSSNNMAKNEVSMTCKLLEPTSQNNNDNNKKKRDNVLVVAFLASAMATVVCIAWRMVVCYTRWRQRRGYSVPLSPTTLSASTNTTTTVLPSTQHVNVCAQKIPMAATGESPTWEENNDEDDDLVI